MKKSKKCLIIASALFILFSAFTVCVSVIDVRPAGYEGGALGFSSLNLSFYESAGSNAYFDKASDAFMIIALIVAAVFAAIGAVQLIKRKSLFKVDAEILITGALYILTVIFYALFEAAVINNRPGAAEASYPSSHTFITMTVLLAAAITAKRRIADKKITAAISVICCLVSALAALCRLFSGEHWLTDVTGGVILSAALVMFFIWALALTDEKKEKTEKAK